MQKKIEIFSFFGCGWNAIWLFYNKYMSILFIYSVFYVMYIILLVIL